MRHIKRFCDYIFIPLMITLLVFRADLAYGPIAPLEEGQYLAPINEVLRGNIPYRDIFFQFGPLDLHMSATWLQWFGVNALSLRGYFMFFWIVRFILIYFLARHVFKKPLFLYLAMFFIVIEAHHPIWCCRWGGIRHIFGIVTLICLLHYSKKEKTRWIFAAGITSALAFLSSYEVGVFSICASVFFIVSAYWADHKHTGEFHLLCTQYVLGCLSVAVPFCIIYAAQGALFSYLKIAFILITGHLGHSSQPLPPLPTFSLHAPLAFFQGLPSLWMKIPFPFIVFALGALFYSMKKRRETLTIRNHTLAAIAIYGALTYAVSFRAIHTIQFQLALPIAILFTIMAMEHAYTRIQHLTGPKDHSAILTRIIKTCGHSIVLFSLLFYLVAVPKLSTSTISFWLFYQKMNLSVLKLRLQNNFHPPFKAFDSPRLKGIFTSPEQSVTYNELISYINEHSKKNEPVFCFPDQGMFNFILDRPQITRFNIPIFAWIYPPWKDELLNALKTQRPKLIVMTHDISSIARSLRKNEELLPEVKAYIEQQYTRAETIGEYDILVPSSQFSDHRN